MLSENEPILKNFHKIFSRKVSCSIESCSACMLVVSMNWPLSLSIPAHARIFYSTQLHEYDIISSNEEM